MIDWKKRIASDKAILSGKPIIKNTRISVEFITELLTSGWTEKQILDNYPRLKKRISRPFFHICSYMYDSIRDGLFFELSD